MDAPLSLSGGACVEGGGGRGPPGLKVVFKELRLEPKFLNRGLWMAYSWKDKFENLFFK